VLEGREDATSNVTGVEVRLQERKWGRVPCVSVDVLLDQV
jgi:hypothetical protein